MLLYLVVIGLVHLLCLGYILRDVYDNRHMLGGALISGPCEIRIALIFTLLAVFLIPPLSLYTVVSWVQLHIRYGRRSRAS